MNRQRACFLSKIVSYVVLIAFLFSNVVYAVPLESKLAAQPHVGQLARLPVEYLGELLRGSRVMTELGVTSLEGLFRNLDRLLQEGVIGFPLPDKNDPARIARYIFVDGAFLRVTKKGETVDDALYRLLNPKGVIDTIGDEEVILCEITDENIDAVNAVLSRINPAWKVRTADKLPGTDAGRDRSHLFPADIHKAFEVELRRQGYEEDRIRCLLTLGVSFTVKPGGSVPTGYTVEEGIAINNDAAQIATGVLSSKLGKAITKEEVLDVLRLHEGLHKIIASEAVKVPDIVERLKEYYAKVLEDKPENKALKKKIDKNSPEVKNELDILLCAFARNYNYLPEKGLNSNKFVELSDEERQMLVEELIVHGFIELYKFNNPIRIWEFRAEGRGNIDPGIEYIIVGHTAGILTDKLGLNLSPDPDKHSIVEIYSRIRALGMRDNQKMRNYFATLYRLFRSQKRIILRIMRNFWPSALLDDEDRKAKLGAVGYREDLLEKAGDYKERAKGVNLILNPMNGGRGNEVQRAEYLRIRGKTNDFGAKGADMLCYSDGDIEISIMEAKLLRAIIEAERNIYASVEYQLLGSAESTKSFNEILKMGVFNPTTKKRETETYGQRIERLPNFEIVAVQEGIKLPVFNRRTRSFTTESFGHGNHGIRGTFFFQEAIGHAKKDEETIIRVIYNGDGINNKVDPVIVGWVADGKKEDDGTKSAIPVVIITTTKAAIDRKGGQIGLYREEIRDEDGEPTGDYREQVQILELAQARSAGQERLFSDIGLKSGRYISGNQPGKQYFNTNTVLMNVSVLNSFFRVLIESGLVTEEELVKLMAPVLTLNTKEEYTAVEGALGSVVLSLAGYFDSQPEGSPIRDVMNRLGIRRFLHIVNIDEGDRNTFFTPFKETSDWWFLFKSGRYEMDLETMELRDQHAGEPLPRFNLVNAFQKKGDPHADYYKDVTNFQGAFSGTDVIGLTSLEVTMKPVIFGNVKLKGRVSILNLGNNVVDLNEKKNLLLKKARGFGIEGIREEDGVLVLKDVCILLGDVDIFIADAREEDGDIDSRFFERSFYKMKDTGADVPGVLFKIIEKIHDRFEKDPVKKGITDEIYSDQEAKDYVKPTTEFEYPKYDSNGNPLTFDGISLVQGIEQAKLNGLIEEIKGKINTWQGEKRIIATTAGPSQMAVCNGVSISDWERIYNEELNPETKAEINALAAEIQEEGTEETLARRQATYIIVARRITEALRDFKAWRQPVFKPFRITAFPPESDADGKTTVVLTQVPQGAEDLAIVTKMRDAVREKTGIVDYIGFRRYITLGYFIRKFDSSQQYHNFKDLIRGLNGEIDSKSENREYWQESGDIELVLYTDMEHRNVLAKFGWTRGIEGPIRRQVESLVREIKHKHGPVGKMVEKEGRYTEILEMDLKDGRLIAGRVVGEGLAYSKSKRFSREMLERVMTRLIEVYGPGILAVVDAVRVVDNISVSQLAGLPVSPFASLIKEGGKNVMLLDVDAFNNEELLYIVLEHELKESIMTIIPYEDEAIRELTANYMSLKLALEKGIRIDKAQLAELGADLQFFEALEVLQAMAEVTDEQIIAVAIEHMRGMPYYAELFKQFSFAGEWIDRIKDAENQYKAALQIFNDIAEAKAIAAKVKDTVKTVDTTIKGLSNSIKKIRMIVSSMPVIETGFVDGLLRQNKYIRLDVDELSSPKNAYIVEWLKRVTEGKENSPFVFYSTSNQDVGSFLERNDLRQADFPIGTARKDTIDLIEPPNVKESLPEDRLYLPLPYSVSSIYLASQVVLAGGEVGEISDKLALNTIKALYDTLLGREISGELLEELFRTPWTVLPPIVQITGALDALRKAIAEIEKAA